MVAVPVAAYHRVGLQLRQLKPRNGAGGIGVEENTVSGGSVNDLKELIARKTNLTWKQPVTFLNFSLKNLSNRDDSFQGPRL